MRPSHHVAIILVLRKRRLLAASGSGTWRRAQRNALHAQRRRRLALRGGDTTGLRVMGSNLLVRTQQRCQDAFTIILMLRKRRRLATSGSGTWRARRPARSDPRVACRRATARHAARSRICRCPRFAPTPLQHKTNDENTE